jgi:alkylated DNA repair dioxygenase AlkB
MIDSLFGPSLPEGFVYRDSFITPDEEAALVAHISQVEFSTFEMHGVSARRRVAFFGRSYDATRIATPHLPPFLLPLRDRIAEWARLDPSEFVMALINEYPPGAPIGWHRDAPQYGIVGGVSLLSACRMKLRPYVSPGARGAMARRVATHEIPLAPRSAYLMIGEARQNYEHHIPPVDTLRYSITFRTARSG